MNELSGRRSEGEGRGTTHRSPFGRRPPWLLALLALAAALAPLRAETVTTVLDNGSPANRVDLVVLGDGYTASQMTRYAADVQRIVLFGFFHSRPFGDYETCFNVHRIDVVSNESGADNPAEGIFRDTALDASFWCLGRERGLCVNTQKVRDVLNRSVDANMQDIVLVLVNDLKYGGSGGAYAVISTNGASLELALHEIGHSFGLLGDEYAEHDCTAPSEPGYPNVTAETRREHLKWNVGGGPPTGWVDPATPVPTDDLAAGVPGLYEGAGYCNTGLYRPTLDSKMRTLGKPFDPVNEEQLILRIYDLVHPLEARRPTAGTLKTHLLGDLAFSVTTVQNAWDSVRTDWFVNGAHAGTGTGFYFNPRLWGPGAWTVRAETRDLTPSVRHDPENLLYGYTQWQVTVDPAGDLNQDGVVDLLDLAVLGNTLAGRIAPGSAPCLCPACGDLDSDGSLTAADAAWFAGWFAR